MQAGGRFLLPGAATYGNYLMLGAWHCFWTVTALDHVKSI